MRIAAATLAIIVGLASAGAQAGGTSRLDEARLKVDQELDRLGVDRGRIKSIYVAPAESGREAPGRSYAGWVSFNDCRGNLVIDLSQTNAVRTIYTTGDCKVPGVR